MSAGKQRSAATILLLLIPFSPPHKQETSLPESWNRRGTVGREISAPTCGEVEALLGFAAFPPGAKLPLLSVQRENRMQIQKKTHQLPGIADVVGVFTDIPKSVGVPGQGRVDGDADDLTSQRKAGRATAGESTSLENPPGGLLVWGRKVPAGSYPRMFCLTAGNPGMFS